MIDLDLIKSFSIDKSDWVTVKFGDLAYEPKESVKDPVAEGIEHVVGLEHIDSEDIHLRHSASIEESTTFTKRFRKGDILFGRRRAYLKKAAKAEFDGICSGDITVMRANEELLLPELLPFIVNNDKFFDYAIEHSAGGLSPRVKFKDLANYEVYLPTRSQQVKLCRLFNASDELLQQHSRFSSLADVFFAAQKNNVVLQGYNNEIEYSDLVKSKVAKNWRIMTIGEMLAEGLLIEIQDGNHGETHPKRKDYVDNGIPFIMANTFVNGNIDFSASKKLPQKLTDKLRVGFALSGDLLLTHKGTIGEVAIVPDSIEWPYIMLTPQVTYYRVNTEKTSTDFLYFAFTSSYFQQQILSLSSQSTRAYLGITAQKNLKIIIPPTKEKQDEVVSILQSSNYINQSAKRAEKSFQILQRKLVEQVF